MWGLLSPLKWSCKKWRKVILTSDLLTKQNDLGTWLQWTGCQVEQKSPRSIRLVQHPDVANAAAVGNGTCRCLAALRTSFALLGVIICCEGVLWAHLAVSTGAFPQHVTLKISCSVNLQLTPAAKGSPILSKLTWNWLSCDSVDHTSPIWDDSSSPNLKDSLESNQESNCTTCSAQTSQVRSEPSCHPGHDLQPRF